MKFSSKYAHTEKKLFLTTSPRSCHPTPFPLRGDREREKEEERCGTSGDGGGETSRFQRPATRPRSQAPIVDSHPTNARTNVGMNDWPGRRKARQLRTRARRSQRVVLVAGAVDVVVKVVLLLLLLLPLRPSERWAPTPPRDWRRQPATPAPGQPPVRAAPGFLSCRCASTLGPPRGTSRSASPRRSLRSGAEKPGDGARERDRERNRGPAKFAEGKIQEKVEEGNSVTLSLKNLSPTRCAPPSSKSHRPLSKRASRAHPRPAPRSSRAAAPVSAVPVLVLVPALSRCSLSRLRPSAPPLRSALPCAALPRAAPPASVPDAFCYCPAPRLGLFVSLAPDAHLPVAGRSLLPRSLRTGGCDKAAKVGINNSQHAFLHIVRVRAANQGPLGLAGADFLP
ncbi:hypothetical protein MPTK2_3g13390 [Marchantia polymorpha subsp. ruderalis]